VDGLLVASGKCHVQGTGAGQRTQLRPRPKPEAQRESWDKKRKKESMEDTEKRE